MFKIYHNPRCSKSRETLKILTDQGVQLEVVEYLKTPITLDELEVIYKALALPVEKMIRTKEETFLSSEVDLGDIHSVFKAIQKDPILLERPIVLKGNLAVLGRPPENVLKLI